MGFLSLKRLADGRTVYVDAAGNVFDEDYVLGDGERLTVPMALCDSATQRGMADLDAKFANVPIRRPGWRPPILDGDIANSGDDPRVEAYAQFRVALADAWRGAAWSDADRPPSLADTTRDTRTELPVDARLFADAHVPLADTETEYARMVQRLRDSWSLPR